MWQLSGPVRPTPPILSFLQMRTAWGPAVFPAPHSPPHARSSFSALWASLIHTQGVSLSHLHTKTHHTNPTRTDTRPRDTQALTVIWQHPRLTSPHPAQPQGCAPSTHNTVVSPLTSLEKETPQLWSLLSHTLSIPLPGPPHLLQHPAPPSPPETPERRPTVSSASRRDLLLGEKLVTLLQLSVLKGSPRRPSDGCARLGLQPDLPQEGRAVAGRAGCWDLLSGGSTSRGSPTRHPGADHPLHGLLPTESSVLQLSKPTWGQGGTQTGMATPESAQAFRPTASSQPRRPRAWNLLCLPDTVTLVSTRGRLMSSSQTRRTVISEDVRP